MPTARHADPDVLLIYLKPALRHGCRASRLMRYATRLIDLLLPIDERTVAERANIVETLLRAACESYGEPWAEALSTLLGLAPGAHGSPLKERRRRAANILGMQPDTFRRHYETNCLWDVAVALDYLAVS